MREIPLSRGLVAIVDDGDFGFLNQWKWSAVATGSHAARLRFYAIRTRRLSEVIPGLPRAILMHRLLAGAKAGEIVDHLDRDSLNNRRNNLRVCSQSLNSVNRAGNQTGRKTSRYKGVYWQKDISRWRARFRLEYLGTFRNEEEAAMAYNVAAAKYAPDHVLLNEVEMG